MVNLQIEAFNPTKAELLESVSKYESLEIKGVEDSEGYNIVDVARKDLKRKRVEIQKTGKSLREDAIAFQKKVITVEKELIGIIDPVETKLENKLKVIDDLIFIEKRKELLPMMREKLATVDCIVEDSFLQLMDDNKFYEFFMAKKEEFLAKKELELKAEQEKAKRLAEIEQAKKEAEKQAREDAERKAELEKMKLENEKKELEQAKLKSERDAELAKIKAEQDAKQAMELAILKHQEEIKQIEALRLKKEADDKAKAESDRIAKELEEAKKLKEKNVNLWLSENGYDNSAKFIVQHFDTEIKLFELKSTFKK